MNSRIKLIGFMLLPAVIVAAVVLWFYSGNYAGRTPANRLHAAGPDELNRRMEAIGSEMKQPDLFTLDDGVIYIRRNRERLKSFTVTSRVAGTIKRTHREGEPWGPNMAGTLPPDTKLYRVINQPELLAVKTETDSVFYTEVAFDR